MGMLPTYFFRKFIYILHGIWAIPVVMVIRIIRPIILIKVGTFLHTRIGHFAADVGQEWAKYNSKEENYIQLYWLDKRSCNNQWNKMARRNLPIFQWVKYVDLWNNFLFWGEVHSNTFDASNGSRDLKGVLERSQVKMLTFTTEEDESAKRWLSNQGWKDGDKFVCLLVRDAEYLNTEDTLSEYNFDYHSYRNSDISSYLPAMEWLADQGIWVLRMGKRMEKNLHSSSPRIIDYAFLDSKSDFLDIWLFANCNLCITTLSGPDMVSDVYRRPLLAINYLPIIDMYSWSNSINYPKHLVWNNSNVSLKLAEIIDHQYTNSEDYETAGIKVVSLTSSEIMNVVQECWKKLEGGWEEDDEESQRQTKFWEIINRAEGYSRNHGYIHPSAQISSILLKNNPHFLD
jgi:putative glycosyltransferase (TIGR04372 family)